MTKRLFCKAILKFLSGVILVGVLLFLPAGTLEYSYGWFFMGILFIPMFIAGIVLMLKNPDLLAKRLSAKEKEREQITVIKLSALMFLLGFISAGLNFRYNFFLLPQSIFFIAVFIFLISYALYAEVMRENTYLSRIVEVQENQKVVDTGLYGIVRHPMYAVTLMLFLSIPLVLGSPLSLVFFGFYPFIIAKRIKNEESVLERELQGYTEYKKKVKYKLIPFIW